jgi:hypothetical protein
MVAHLKSTENPIKNMNGRIVQLFMHIKNLDLNQKKSYKKEKKKEKSAYE